MCDYDTLRQQLRDEIASLERAQRDTATTEALAAECQRLNTLRDELDRQADEADRRLERLEGDAAALRKSPGRMRQQLLDHPEHMAAIHAKRGRIGSSELAFRPPREAQACPKLLHRG